MEDTSSKSSIGMPLNECFTEMFFLSGTTTGNDGNREVVGQLPECLIGITGLDTIMIHTCKENLSCAALLDLMCPFKETSFCTFTPPFKVAMPTVFVVSCVNSADADL